LDKLIEKRLHSRSVGFHSEVVDKADEKDFYSLATTKDIIQYGFIPEFVGRFGLISNVTELDIDSLVRILKEPKNSLIKQYQYIFELDGIELVFDDSAIEQIAQKAKDLKTNARGLKNIIEKTLLPYQFDAVNLAERGLTQIRISKDTIAGTSPAIMKFNKTVNEQK
jgi:ATP-dependent Clp protease ATP-binding subunit ClpX